MLVPSTMKKGRPGLWLVVVCEVTDSERLAAVLRICQRMNSLHDLPQLLDLVAEEAARPYQQDQRQRAANDYRQPHTHAGVTPPGKLVGVENYPPTNQDTNRPQ